MSTSARAVPPGSADRDYCRVPGWDLVSAGLADLLGGRESVEAMLVAQASDRLSGLGFEVPAHGWPDAHLRLYALLEADVGEASAHSRYNALRRRLLSFLRAARFAPRR